MSVCPFPPCGLQRLPKVQGQASAVPSIMLADYPAASPSRDISQLERDMDYVQTIVTSTRKLRTDYGLVKQKPRLFVVVAEAGGRLGGKVQDPCRNSLMFLDLKA